MGKELIEECKGKSAIRLPSHKSDHTSSVLSGWKEGAAIRQCLKTPKDGSCITSRNRRNDNFLHSGQTEKPEYLVQKQKWQDREMAYCGGIWFSGSNTLLEMLTLVSSQPRRSPLLSIGIFHWIHWQRTKYQFVE